MPKPLIIDHGPYTSLAARLARDVEVAYFSSWLNAYPQSREVAPGMGIPNVERINDPISFMLDGGASHIIVPDLCLGGYERLAHELDIPVFGPGPGQDIETDRWHLAEFLESHGLPVIGKVEVEGLEALREVLEKEKDRYVKVSTFRGDLETYHSRSWASTQSEFNQWKVQFGALGETMRFMVEDPIKNARELGIDTFFRNGVFTLPFFYGPEIKDGGYAGKLMADYSGLPDGVALVMEALAEYFAKNNYNCFFSNEMRIVGQDVYMTDATCRIPSPPGGAIMGSMKNFTPFILDGGEPEYSGKWICEIVLKSDVAAKTWLMVDIPKAVSQNIALHNYCIVDGHNWVIPHDSKYVEIGSACGWGDALEEAKEMALDAAKAVEADGLRFDDHVLDKAEEEFAKAGVSA